MSQINKINKAIQRVEDHTKGMTYALDCGSRDLEESSRVLVREIFELIDTYYIDWQAEEIRKKILDYIAKNESKQETEQ